MYVLILLDTAAGPCCPQINLQAPGSCLDALPGYQAYVVLKADYGNCTGDHKY